MNKRAHYEEPFHLPADCWLNIISYSDQYIVSSLNAVNKDLNEITAPTLNAIKEFIYRSAHEYIIQNGDPDFTDYNEAREFVESIHLEAVGQKHHKHSDLLLQSCDSNGVVYVKPERTCSYPIVAHQIVPMVEDGSIINIGGSDYRNHDRFWLKDGILTYVGDHGDDVEFKLEDYPPTYYNTTVDCNAYACIVVDRRKLKFRSVALLSYLYDHYKKDDDMECKTEYFVRYEHTVPFNIVYHLNFYIPRNLGDGPYWLINASVSSLFGCDS